MNLPELHTDLRFRVYCFAVLAVILTVAGEGMAGFIAIVAALTLQSIAIDVENAIAEEDIDAIVAVAKKKEEE